MALASLFPLSLLIDLKLIYCTGFRAFTAKKAHTLRRLSLDPKRLIFLKIRMKATMLVGRRIIWGRPRVVEQDGKQRSKIVVANIRHVIANFVTAIL